MAGTRCGLCPSRHRKIVEWPGQSDWRGGFLKRKRAGPVWRSGAITFGSTVPAHSQHGPLPFADEFLRLQSESQSRAVPETPRTGRFPDYVFEGFA
jgi:hypothetical protein